MISVWNICYELCMDDGLNKLMFCIRKTSHANNWYNYRKFCYAGCNHTVKFYIHLWVESELVWVPSLKYFMKNNLYMLL